MPDTTTPAALARSLPVHLLRAELLDWYDGARRELPWRAPPGQAPDPWPVLVSELMLQQTTVATVRGRFLPFMTRFPTVEALAEAPLEAALHAWQGLGYYRRAQALHACAVAVVERHGGRLPLEAEALAALPGIGPYTAYAVAAIAGERPLVPVDGNVERVLARLLAMDQPLPAARPALRAAAQVLAAEERPGDFAQALMELGALICTPRRPACLTCPWRSWCRAAAQGEPGAYPRKALRSPRPVRYATAFLLERTGDGAVLFQRRPLNGLLGGMVELPTTPWLEDAEEVAAGAMAAAPASSTWHALAGEVRHVFSHLDLRVRLLRGTTSSGLDGRLWAPPSSFRDLALPTFTTKLLRYGGLRW